MPASIAAEHAGARGAGHLGVEVDRVAVVGEGGVQVGGPALDAVRLGERRAACAALRPTRIGSGITHGAVGERDAALLPDRQDRADQVLA